VKRRPQRIMAYPGCPPPRPRWVDLTILCAPEQIDEPLNYRAETSSPSPQALLPASSCAVPSNDVISPPRQGAGSDADSAVVARVGIALARGGWASIKLLGTTDIALDVRAGIGCRSRMTTNGKVMVHRLVVGDAGRRVQGLEAPYFFLKGVEHEKPATRSHPG
jgi:hypothetical protein